MRFADQWNARQGAFNQQFGEAVRIEPMVIGNYGSSPDGERPVIETIAILRFGDDARQLMSGDHESNRVRGRIGVQEVSASFERSALGPHELKKGDRLIALERSPPDREFVLSDPYNDGVGRIAYRLVRT
jgi:hypothetical protein